MYLGHTRQCRGENQTRDLPKVCRILLMVLPPIS